MTAQARWVDLSFPIREGMTRFPSRWHPAVSVTRLASHRVERRESRRLVLGTHTGTHLDAPRHFIEGGRGVDSFPPELMTGTAGIVDLMPAEPRKEYGLPDVRRSLGRRRVRPRMLVRFGWTRRYGGAGFYTEAPYLSLEACLWLAGRGVRLLGLDTPSVDCHDHGWRSGNDAPNHRALLGRGVFLVESLANLDKLAGRAVRLMVFPLNIPGADGSPARCFAAQE
ncbi:MAG: cyclase family protein [Elusimicrobia bacterium]|nr:cyclase family protein [Elusimicrobiota bacterium]